MRQQSLRKNGVWKLPGSKAPHICGAYVGPRGAIQNTSVFPSADCTRRNRCGWTYCLERQTPSQQSLRTKLNRQLHGFKALNADREPKRISVLIGGMPLLGGRDERQPSPSTAIRREREVPAFRKLSSIGNFRTRSLGIRRAGELRLLCATCELEIERAGREWEVFWASCDPAALVCAVAPIQEGLPQLPRWLVRPGAGPQVRETLQHLMAQPKTCRQVAGSSQGPARSWGERCFHLAMKDLAARVWLRRSRLLAVRGRIARARVLRLLRREIVANGVFRASSVPALRPLPRRSNGAALLSFRRANLQLCSGARVPTIQAPRSNTRRGTHLAKFWFPWPLASVRAGSIAHWARMQNKL